VFSFQELFGSRFFMMTLRNLPPLIACLFSLISFAESSSPQAFPLSNGFRLRPVFEETWLLGVQAEGPDGILLNTGESLRFPLLADEWADAPFIGIGLRISEIHETEGGWDLYLEIFGTGDQEAWQAYILPTRDAYRLTRLQPLPDITRLPHRRQILQEHGASLELMGRLIWHLRPVSDPIAGHPWAGWREWLSFSLNPPHQTTAVRLLGGLEPGGTLEGLTLAQLRYRGFGRLEQPIHTDDAGRSLVSYNTQDLPIPEGFHNRSDALPRDLAHATRNESWIHTPARGAGSPFMDFVFSPATASVSFPARQGDVRSLTELYTDDTVLGQLNEELFAQTREGRTIPLHHLVLTPDRDRAVHFWRTRYLELDLELRARIGAELEFLTDKAVPSVGYLFDFWGATDRFAPVVARMAGFAGELAELGVQRVMVHNPGWKNGRAAMRGWDGMSPEDHVGGGVNSIYDWRPLPHVISPWRDTSRIYDRLGIEYHVWITGMARREASFIQEIGEAPEHWALNSPGGPPNETYGVDLVKFNIHSPRFRETFTERLAEVRRTAGFQGFWGDSFQNLFMSQLDWAAGDGAPMQRAWWEWLADQSRQGVGWISESHSFPGLSCSIEVDAWDETPWMMGFTTRWLRGHDQTTRSPEAWGDIAFALAAFQGALAPEIWPYYAQEEMHPEQVIRNFGRINREARAAAPVMERPWILPDGKGVLWTSSAFPGQAALFAFKNFRLGETVRVVPVLDASGQTLDRVTAGRVFRVISEDPLAAFDIEAPPLEDVRTPLPVRPPSRNLPENDDKVWHFRQPPGDHRPLRWAAGETIWQDRDGIPRAWPEDGSGPGVRFPAGVHTSFPVEGRIRAESLHAPAPGVTLLIDTVRDRAPGDQLHLDGPLTGPVDIFFRGTLRGPEGVHTPLRAETGLRFGGGGQYDLAANLLPWPERHHLHSQLVTLTDPGTTVHFRGRWPAMGELSRPGLLLDDATRFVIRPEADFPFIKSYGGFTLQLWVTGLGEHGGTLELHPDFVADRSRRHMSPFQPDPGAIALGSLGSIRLNRATLVTHMSHSLPMTARARQDDAGTLQNNGHLVFEGGGEARWEVRTRPQTYAGAVWIHSDVTLDLHRDLTHTGITEEPDEEFQYLAANAFQTVRDRHTRPGPLRITKTGPAALILAGEQAYAEDSHLIIENGSVVFMTDPFAGRTFPRGEEQTSANLKLTVAPHGTVIFDAAEIHLDEFELQKGATAEWRQPATLHVNGTAHLETVRLREHIAEAFDLIRAGKILGGDIELEGPGMLKKIQEESGQVLLRYIPENRASEQSISN
jgi:hypothetical protein